MSKSSFGGRRPKYSFCLNPYRDVRFTRCPKCERMTSLRKFALLIHLEGFGLIVLGKTSRFCRFCELIIVHQDELELETARVVSNTRPIRSGNRYFVVGTVPLSTWKLALRNKLDIETVRNLSSDFKNQLKFTRASDD